MKSLILLSLLLVSTNAFHFKDLLPHHSSDQDEQLKLDGECPADLRETLDEPSFPDIKHNESDPDAPRPPHPPGPRPPHPPGRHHPHGPPFYHGAIGPRFKVVNRTCGYQIRQYNASNWAATKVESWAWELALHKGFGVLAPYFGGDNANHTRFPPTVPLVSHFIPRNNYSDCGKEFLISAYIPKCSKSNSTIPAPKNTDVEIVSLPPTQIYVRQFGGLGLHWSVLHETFAFARALKRNQVDVKDGKFFAAQYDGPTTLFHRHNEIWFVEGGNKTSTAADSISSLWGSGLTINPDSLTE